MLRSNAGGIAGYIVKDFFNHKWVFDYQALESCLLEVCFSKVIRQEFRKSLDAEYAAMDGEVKAFESLYINAVK